MKRLKFVCAGLLTLAAGSAMAVCEANNRVNGASLSTLLTNSLVCGRPAAGYPGGSTDRWQEEHLAGGALFDYKLGSNPVDPREQVGTWAIGSNDVTHAYTGGSSFIYSVHSIPGSAGTFSFCSGSTEIVRAFIGANTGTGCGGSFPP